MPKNYLLDLKPALGGEIKTLEDWHSCWNKKPNKFMLGGPELYAFSKHVLDVLDYNGPSKEKNKVNKILNRMPEDFLESFLIFDNCLSCN